MLVKVYLTIKLFHHFVDRASFPEMWDDVLNVELNEHPNIETYRDLFQFVFYESCKNRQYINVDFSMAQTYGPGLDDKINIMGDPIIFGTSYGHVNGLPGIIKGERIKKTSQFTFERIF